MADYWFVSDLHFGHKRMILNGYRPYQTVEAMDRDLMDQWNSVVPKDAEVLVLGDFSMLKPDMTSSILGWLNGNKTLIRGNHDHSKALKKVVGWNRVRDYLDLKIGDDHVVLSHFPMLSWHRMHYGAYHLHGHSHGSLRYPRELANARIFDVGVDSLVKHTGSYAPVRWEDLKSMMASRAAVSVDHHEPTQSIASTP